MKSDPYSGDARPPSPSFAYVVRELAVPVAFREPDLGQEIAQFLRIKRGRISFVRILRKSLDSRRRNHPLWRYTLEFTFDGILKHPRVSAAKSAVPPGGEAPARTAGLPDSDISFPASQTQAPGGTSRHRPPGPRVAVIGSGPAGLAAALGLGRKGYAVTVFEQGADVGRRFKDIRRFLKGDIFNPRSNILFGEGGAGTFSDGKLTCRTRNAFTDAFLAELVACGADPAITYESHPHIGTDKLQFIIKAFRTACEALGCRFRFDTKVADLVMAGGRVAGVIADAGPEAFDAVVLASGHSSRELYARLAAHGVVLEPKPFAVGVRVEHPQDMVNRRQLGDRVDASIVGAAEYFLTWNGHAEPAQGASAGRQPAGTLPPGETGAPTRPLSAYSFCMCPGGVVVPCADAPDGLFTNGMSYSNRAGAFANSAVVVPVTPEELADPEFNPLAGARSNPSINPLAGARSSPAINPLAGFEFIRDLEIRAFALGGGDFVFPAQTIRAYMEGRTDDGPLPKTSFPKPLRWADFRRLFPSKLALALQESFRNFESRMPGFIDGLIIGPESRTSSPVRILRDARTLESASTPGLFPLGEGAGYSGGIVSSGADGLRLADGWEAWSAPSPGLPAARAAGGTAESRAVP